MEEVRAGWKAVLSAESALLELGDIEFDKVIFQKRTNAVIVRFKAARFLDAAQHGAISRAVRRVLASTNAAIRVEIAYPTLKDKFIENPQEYCQVINELLAQRMPGLSPYLTNAVYEIKSGVLTMTVDSSIGQDVLQQKKADQVLENMIRELFLHDMPVSIHSKEIEESIEAFLLERARMDEEAGKIADAALENKKKQADGPQVVFGRAIVSANVTPMSELNERTGRVCVEGYALDAPEKRSVKGGNLFIVSFGVTDYTGSVLCKAFVDPENAPKFDKIKKNDYIKVRGSCTFDTFSKDLALSIDDLSLMPRPKREDLEEEKRVELHLHTQMSTMDGVSPVSDLIERAAAFGHEAIAITDHGVVQAFPKAFDTLNSLKKKGTPIKLIPGMEGYLVDDSGVIVTAPDEGGLHRSYVVFDIETTGLKAGKDRIIEVAAVKIEDGKILDEFETLVNPRMRIPEDSIKIHGIRDDMVQDAPLIDEVVKRFAAFCEGQVICAHNASFDVGFMRIAAREAGVTLPNMVLDTLPLARAVVPELKRHRLDTLCKKLGITLDNHHRALFDTRATAYMLMQLLERAEKNYGVQSLKDLNTKLGRGVASSGQSHHIVILAKNQEGLKNLYTLVSISHMDHFNRRPHVFKSELQKYREGLILGSACEAGELIRAIVSGKSEKQLEQIASFYDYLEIQPIGNNAFMLRNGEVESQEELRDINRRVLQLGDKLSLPTCATCDVHFMDPQDAIFREILMHGMGFDDASEQAPLYFRTTREMLDEFAYLGERAKEVVVDNPRKIASMVEEISMFPKHPTGAETFQPHLEGAEETIRDMAEGNARKIYGDPVPDIIRKRLDKELNSIIGNGFATLYLNAHLLIKKSNEDGYYVGSRGSVGSSFVAMLCGITEVNPLPPHYFCPNCSYSDFDVDKDEYPCGIDLPHRACPNCAKPLSHDGHDIPFEVFLGFDGDKVPDIDLNFSGAYQPKAHKYVEEMFGKAHVFRAGTIGTLAEKTAYGFVKKYLDEKEKSVTKVEEERLVKGCTGVKRTTGQHPGGMVIVPEEFSVYNFSPIQHPADDKDSGIVTTHFEFKSLHDILVKLDILGHDDPTMINMLERLTGKKSEEIELNDRAVMSLFTSPDALRVTPEQIGCNTGTLGIPEFGTKFVRQMLEDTKPSTMGELIRISGLSHGTNVWLNNAQDLVKGGIATLRECFCTRDDIMNYLIGKGAEDKMAFTTMEAVRKGRKLTADMEKTMRELSVPEYYIDSCNKIEYMFPRAHAAAYVTMAIRVGWFKIFEPLAYYASYFTVRADEFDASIMLDEPEGLKARMKRIERLPRGEMTKLDERVYTLLEIVNEMRQRGFAFLPIDLYKSSFNEFTIEDGKLRPPFNSLPGVGDAAAEALARAREAGPFISVEDLQLRSKVSSAVIETLRASGALKGLPETSQVNLFSVFD